jgi:predicted ABC-type ATPase
MPIIRMFAGPNGSGKSTIIDSIIESRFFNIGVYLNADNIERLAKDIGEINLSPYGIKDLEGDELKNFILKHSLFYKVKSNDAFPYSIVNNSILKTNEFNSYDASIIVDFIRNYRVARKLSFSFETVMSHKSKCEFFANTQKLGYRNYLYYISTDSVDINIARVQARVIGGGHDVPIKKIKDRYLKSMSLLKQTIPFTKRAFIIDNSKEAKLILDIEDGNKVNIRQSYIPKWVSKYILE